jgi:putative hydrolase of HD superfamily
MVKGQDLSPFFQSALKLKSIKRAGWVSKVKVQVAESVADHVFATSAIAMLLSDMVGLDTARVMKMAESVVGDYMPGDVSANEKMQQEKKAMDGILAGLPAAIRSDYSDIWYEYLDNKTDLARFVHRIDKLEMAMQASAYATQGYDKELLKPFFNTARAALGDSDDIVGQTFASFASLDGTDL